MDLRKPALVGFHPGKISIIEICRPIPPVVVSRFLKQETDFFNRRMSNLRQIFRQITVFEYKK
ncbi:MAG: hypothetical protein A2Y79_06720 [Deltaproteobacteria bacterium RBG_13_43_22]|nr:MAG: hypothetical protein A2Y79_06720 [Deltaproteobacteria bacterium RBG_13_43_22]